MSLSLKLLPIKFRNNFSHEVLIVDDFDEDKIMSLNQMEVDDDFNSHLCHNENGGCYGLTMKDDRGDILMYCLAKDLKMVGLTGSVGAYVDNMRDKDKIALFWC